MVKVNYTKFVDGLGVRIWSQEYGSMKSAETVLEQNGYERYGEGLFSKRCWRKEADDFHIIAYVNKPTD